MKKIYSNKETYMVSDEDYLFLKDLKWFTHHTGNAFAHKNRKRIWMHRIIMGNPDNMLVDHKDHNVYNNQRSNLRVCTRQENNRNRIRRKKGKDGVKYLGVSTYSSNRNRYRARITDPSKSGESFYLGSFDTPDEAANAYNKAAKKLFGEFACLNRIG